MQSDKTKLSVTIDYAQIWSFQNEIKIFKSSICQELILNYYSLFEIEQSSVLTLKNKNLWVKNSE